MLCIAYAHSAYDCARLMWIAVEKKAKRLTGFSVLRHQSRVPVIDKAHQAYYIAVPATTGTHDDGKQ